MTGRPYTRADYLAIKSATRRAAGNLHATMCEAAADGKLTSLEAKRIERASTDLDDANELLSADMRRIQAGERA